MSTDERVRVDAQRSSLAYDGFISYSHAADDLLAPRLQSALQRFAKPWWKRRAVRIFRDESSLSANPHLWSSITEALDTSGWFVLLLSPDAAQSEWVNQEIAYWVEHRDPSRILPVVTDGEFGWDRDVVGSSVPEALRGVFIEEPRWVDLRGVDTETELDLQNPEFAAAVADIASTIRGVPKDELASEEVRQHRRTVRTAWAVGLGLVGLSVASALLAFQANQSAEAAEVARQAEITNRLASQAPIVFQTDAQLGLLLAVEAFNREQSPVTLGALQRVLVGSRNSLGYVGSDVEYRDLAWIDDERFLASHHLGVDLIGIDGSVTNLGFGNGAWLIELSPDRALAAVSTPNNVSIVDAGTGSATGVALPHPQVRSIAFSPDGTVLATGDLYGLVYFWEVTSGRQLGDPVEAHPESTFEEFGLRTVDIEGIVAHQTDTFRIGAVELSFSSDGLRLVTAGMVVARAWDVDRRQKIDEVLLERLNGGDKQPTSALGLRQSTAGEPVTIVTNGQVLEWTPGSGAAPDLIRSFDNVSGAGMTLALTDAVVTERAVLFAPDGGRLVGAELTDAGSEWALDSLLGGQAHIAVSPSGDRVAHSGDGAVAVWSLNGDGPISVSVPGVSGDEVVASINGDVVVNALDQPARLFRLEPTGLVQANEVTSWDWMWVVDGRFFGEAELGSLEGPWRLDPETLEPLFQLALSDGNSVFAIDGLTTGLTAIGGISQVVDVSAADGSSLAVLEGLGAPVGSVDISPDGARVVAADILGAAQIWDLEASSPVGSTALSGGGGQVVVVEYDPSGEYLVTISQEGTISLRDPESLQPTATLEGMGGIGAGGGSFGPFFQTDSRYMVTTADGPGRLWDLDELVQVGGTFPNDPGKLAQASSDGRWLVTVADGDLVLWDLDTSLWAERACRAAGRNLTQNEWIQFLGEEAPYRAACPMWGSEVLDQGDGT